jgi:hypothetical protein
MKTYEYSGATLPASRSHPWTEAVANSECRYYDLKAAPALIRTSLEDFVPWGHHRAIELFYVMLEWLNGPTSPFESNDCALTAPQPNENPHSPLERECSGRLMILFRDCQRNVGSRDLSLLTRALHIALATADLEFESGVVGTTLVPVRYLSLPGLPEAQLGSQLMISFWAWGGTDEETMANLHRLMKNLDHALHAVADDETAFSAAVDSTVNVATPRILGLVRDDRR